jgi:hypothetical protein
MPKTKKRGKYIGAEDLGIEGVTHTTKRVEVMPKGGFKTVKDKSVSITLPRIKFLEIEIPATPTTTKKNKGGRPRKRSAA